MTYSTELVSDLHKDAYGYRPRDRFFADWAESTGAEKQEVWDIMTATLEANAVLDREQELEATAAMEEYINSLGAPNRTTALREMMFGKTFYSNQCVEGWVWEKGLLFTDYGKRLVTELLQVVELKGNI